MQLLDYRIISSVSILFAVFGLGVPAHAPKWCVSCQIAAHVAADDFRSLLRYTESELTRAYREETDPDAKRLLEEAIEAVFTRCAHFEVPLDGTPCD